MGQISSHIQPTTFQPAVKKKQAPPRPYHPPNRTHSFVIPENKVLPNEIAHPQLRPISVELAARNADYASIWGNPVNAKIEGLQKDSLEKHAENLAPFVSNSRTEFTNHQSEDNWKISSKRYIQKPVQQVQNKEKTDRIEVQVGKVEVSNTSIKNSEVDDNFRLLKQTDLYQETEKQAEDIKKWPKNASPKLKTNCLLANGALPQSYHSFSSRLNSPTIIPKNEENVSLFNSDTFNRTSAVSLPQKCSFHIAHSHSLTYAQLAEKRRQKVTNGILNKTGTNSSFLRQKSLNATALSTKSINYGPGHHKKGPAPAPPGHIHKISTNTLPIHNSSCMLDAKCTFDVKTATNAHDINITTNPLDIADERNTLHWQTINKIAELENQNVAMSQSDDIHHSKDQKNLEIASFPTYNSAVLNPIYSSKRLQTTTFQPTKTPTTATPSQSNTTSFMTPKLLKKDSSRNQHSSIVSNSSPENDVPCRTTNCEKESKQKLSELPKNSPLTCNKLEMGLNKQNPSNTLETSIPESNELHTLQSFHSSILPPLASSESYTRSQSLTARKVSDQYLPATMYPVSLEDQYTTPQNSLPRIQSSNECQKSFRVNTPNTLTVVREMNSPQPTNEAQDHFVAQRMQNPHNFTIKQTHLMDVSSTSMLSPTSSVILDKENSNDSEQKYSAIHHPPTPLHSYTDPDQLYVLSPTTTLSSDSETDQLYKISPVPPHSEKDINHRYKLSSAGTLVPVAAQLQTNLDHPRKDGIGQINNMYSNTLPNLQASNSQTFPNQPVSLQQSQCLATKSLLNNQIYANSQPTLVTTAHISTLAKKSHEKQRAPLPPNAKLLPGFVSQQDSSQEKSSPFTTTPTQLVRPNNIKSQTTPNMATKIKLPPELITKPQSNNQDFKSSITVSPPVTLPRYSTVVEEEERKMEEPLEKSLLPLQPELDGKLYKAKIPLPPPLPPQRIPDLPPTPPQRIPEPPPLPPTFRKSNSSVFAKQQSLSSSSGHNSPLSSHSSRSSTISSTSSHRPHTDSMKGLETILRDDILAGKKSLRSGKRKEEDSSKTKNRDLHEALHYELTQTCLARKQRKQEHLNNKKVPNGKNITVGRVIGEDGEEKNTQELDMNSSAAEQKEDTSFSSLTGSLNSKKDSIKLNSSGNHQDNIEKTSIIISQINKSPKPSNKSVWKTNINIKQITSEKSTENQDWTPEQDLCDFEETDAGYSKHITEGCSVKSGFKSSLIPENIKNLRTSSQGLSVNNMKGKAKAVNSPEKNSPKLFVWKSEESLLDGSINTLSNQSSAAPLNISGKKSQENFMKTLEKKSQKEKKEDTEKFQLVKRAGIAYLGGHGEIVVLPNFQNVKYKENGKVVDDDGGRAPKVWSKKKKFNFQSTVKLQEKERLEQFLAKQVDKREEQMKKERQEQLKTEIEFQKMRMKMNSFDKKNNNSPKITKNISVNKTNLTVTKDELEEITVKENISQKNPPKVSHFNTVDKANQIAPKNKGNKKTIYQTNPDNSECTLLKKKALKSTLTTLNEQTPNFTSYEKQKIENLDQTQLLNYTTPNFVPNPLIGTSIPNMAYNSYFHEYLQLLSASQSLLPPIPMFQQNINSAFYGANANLLPQPSQIYPATGFLNPMAIDPTLFSGLMSMYNGSSQDGVQNPVYSSDNDSDKDETDSLYQSIGNYTDQMSNWSSDNTKGTHSEDLDNSFSTQSSAAYTINEGKDKSILQDKSPDSGNPLQSETEASTHSTATIERPS